jgi:hypothetical protein
VDFDVIKGGGKMEGQWGSFSFFGYTPIARYMLV